jgi:hypothetical protein
MNKKRTIIFFFLKYKFYKKYSGIKCLIKVRKKEYISTLLKDKNNFFYISHIFLLTSITLNIL